MDNMLLKEIMKEKGYSQERLALALGMDRSTLNRKLKNVRGGFAVREACRVGRALHMTRTQMLAVFFSDFSA